ncbi:MAG: shikimate kinase [Candidatus Sericytochromatia bacterium]|nr:MAG: shikimate kinase [Candidatus Sericytochromatia bacterium]
MLKNLIITGFMLSGKSSVGKLLSEKIKWNFIDLDKLIEDEEKLSISEIFKLKGEKYFRNIEYLKLRNFLHLKKNIISLGGGTFCSYRNINVIKKVGISILLKSDIDEILERASINQIIKRPLFNNNLKTLFNKRQKFYNKADIKIITKNKTIENICDEIIYKINNLYK